MQDYCLSVNNEKTQILRKFNRQAVTGIVVNQKLSVGVKKKKKIRQEMYYIKKYGLDSHIAYSKIEKQNYIYHLIGSVNWVLTLEKNNKEFLEYKGFLKNLIN